MKYYCPPNCVNGTISKCDVDNDKVKPLKKDTSWTNEKGFPRCPRFIKEKTATKIKKERSTRQ